MVQGQILSWRLGHLLEKLLASAWGHSPEVWLWSQWRITHQSCPSRSLGFSDCAIFHRSVSSANYIPYLAIRYRRTLKLMSHLINNHDSMFFYFWEIVTGSQRQATGTNYFTTDIVLWIFGIPILIFIKLIPLTQCDDWKLRTRVHFVHLLQHYNDPGLHPLTSSAIFVLFVHSHRDCGDFPWVLQFSPTPKYGQCCKLIGECKLALVECGG